MDGIIVISIVISEIAKALRSDTSTNVNVSRDIETNLLSNILIKLILPYFLNICNPALENRCLTIYYISNIEQNIKW